MSVLRHAQLLRVGPIARLAVCLRFPLLGSRCSQDGLGGATGGPPKTKNKRATRGPHDGPGQPQDDPKRAQESLRNGSRRAKRAPRRPERAQKMSQEIAPRGLRDDQEEPKRARGAPRRPKRAPGRSRSNRAPRQEEQKRKKLLSGRAPRETRGIHCQTAVQRTGVRRKGEITIRQTCQIPNVKEANVTYTCSLSYYHLQSNSPFNPPRAPAHETCQHWRKSLRNSTSLFHVLS